jgi:hypothetical protein
MTLIRSAWYYGLAAAFLLFFVAAPASALIIDTFDDVATATANSGTPFDSDTTAAGSFLGTNRLLSATWVSGGNDVDGDVDLAGNSLLIVSLPPDTLGTVAVSWQNIGGADLTEGSTLNAIGIEIVFDDLPADLIVNVTDGSSNTGQSTLATAGGIFAPQEVAIPFASFSGSVDFTDVESISLVVSPLFPATDVQLGFIESTVPEPSTGLLLGLGMAVLGSRRRKLG